MPDASYRFKTVGPTAVIEFQSVSKFTRSDLPRALLGDLAQPHDPPIQNIVADCTAVDYANSLFLEILIQLARHTSSASGQFVLCGASPFLQDVLKVTHLQNCWQICENEQEALTLLEQTN